MPVPIRLITAFKGSGEIEVARTLFLEYTASLRIDLSFQGVIAELAGLPGNYAPPRGQILIAWSREGQHGPAHAVGCVAMRPLTEEGYCEMKRLYVRPQARGQDLGRRLAQAIISCAREAGYARMRLDTLVSMQAAQALYASLGFRPTEPYYDNPIQETRYMGCRSEGGGNRLVA